MYIELYDLLFPIDIMLGNFANQSNVLPKLKRGDTLQLRDFELSKNRLRESDENFFYMATKLFKIVRKTTDKDVTEKLLIQINSSFFHRSYKFDSCSWKVLGSFGTCNASRKLLFDERRVSSRGRRSQKSFLLLLLLVDCFVLYLTFFNVELFDTYCQEVKKRLAKLMSLLICSLPAAHYSFILNILCHTRIFDWHQLYLLSLSFSAIFKPH